MGFPDSIERTVELAHPPDRVWAALTTAEGLSGWFGSEARIDPRPGGSGWMRWPGGETADLRVERAEKAKVFGFTWPITGLPEDDPRRTYVEFTLEPIAAGTLLRVVETGFAQLPESAHREAFEGNVEGWAIELDELVAYLDAS
ncbi:SRPBCC domain-containing protein [Glycomyces tritici]|uniref:SRPBCC domain-containing protein n=1 Tax=Glycomyces tritici TaxID=2665176 RepID=A0ABT7YY27_9ACTN|nr:SRPBCC domain-containing protein [Glycomyces tritici]MDN3241236.1 SRPBCC domain-containing protein [Glycomyces tritici]MDN3243259.1 SRPBCC domain-containing protein [Glycomyces tritici]